MSTNAASAVGSIVSSDGEALTTSSSAIVAAEATAGSHVFHINEYSIVRELGSGDCIKSSTFSVGGQLWNIVFYPDGNDIENAGWISIYLEHDQTDATVEVNARFILGVLDENCEYVEMFSIKTNMVHTYSSKNRCWGFSKFVTRKDLEESPYIRDDCLKVRCHLMVSKGIRTEATTQSVVVPPSNMHHHFGSLLSGAVGADVKFEVAGEVFSAHRCVLAARSSVFMAELFGHMKEKDLMNRVEIQDMEPRVFKAMLHLIYTDNVPDFDKEDAPAITQHLLVAADRYDLERLKLICEEKLCNCIDTTTVAATLVLAEQHGCHGLKNACLDFLKLPRHLKKVMATEGFDHIMSGYPSLIKELLAKVANLSMM